MLVQQLRQRGYRVTSILQNIRIPRQTYYNWIHHEPSKREQEDQRIGKLLLKIWRTDITYLEEHPGHWVYLSSVYNNNDHKIIAYKVAHQMTSNLVTDTLKMALVHYPKPDFVHSDMGSQYTSNQFERLLNKFKIKHSYSLKGYSYDNGPIEAFHSILKREFVYLTKFKNDDDLILKIENYMYWYNHSRTRMAV